MYPMSVTLDVSRLSGWLNASASCRVERESMKGGATCGQAGVRVGWGGWWRKQQGGLDCGGSEGRARAERTLNICCMSVTLDVSKLSGWLNPETRCRVQRGKHRRTDDMWARMREGGVGWSVAQAAGRPRLCRLRAGHLKHVRHVCDAGRVPARYVGVELGQA